jgi:hypothetical protein
MNRRDMIDALSDYCANRDCDGRCMIYDICNSRENITHPFELYSDESLITAVDMIRDTTKETVITIDDSQKAKTDYGKEQLTLVPRRIIHDICAIRMYGNQKYPEGGPDNWKRVEKERYRDAAYRHFLAYLDDPQGKDAESGFPHLWHLACNIAFLCEFEDAEKEAGDEEDA